MNLKQKQADITRTYPIVVYADFSCIPAEFQKRLFPRHSVRKRRDIIITIDCIPTVCSHVSCSVNVCKYIRLPKGDGLVDCVGFWSTGVRL